jgi:effector-binding domain-containing protein
MTLEPEIRELAAEPAVIETAVTDGAGMGAIVDRAFGALFDELAKQGVEPAAAPYVRYIKTGDQLEIELGVPVAPDAVELAGVEQASLPSGRAAVLRHVGPYDGLRAACERLQMWVEERGESASGPFWESYVTNPATERDPAKRITDIYVPLR